MSTSTDPTTATRNSDYRKAMLQRVAQGARAPDAEPPPAGEGAPYVFLAYARDDIEEAQCLVEALRARGFEVRWDGDLRAGENFRHRIARLIDEAACVLVIWSESAVGSDFVIDEAETGKQLGKLLTCRVAGLPDRVIPFGFRQLHCVDTADHRAIVAALGAFGMTESGEG